VYDAHNGGEIVKIMMKKTVSCLMAFIIMMVCIGGAPALAEDAVSSATVKVDHFPVVEKHEDAKVLVAYFSVNDTTRAIALTLADALAADVFEIIPEVPYTEEDLNYNDSSTRATVEQRDTAARPAISALPESLEQYNTILLGYPFWWGKAPRIMETFLESIDVGGKTIIPFCTSASSPAGASADDLKKMTDDTTTWMDVKRFDNGSDAQAIREWAETLKLGEKMKLYINDTAVSVDWEDNESVAALRELVREEPLSVQMSMYGGFEQVGSLGSKLPRNDSQTTTEAGDIVLYSGNQIVIFYGSNSWSYTRLGRITDKSAVELAEMLGNGDVAVTLSTD
jgi:flavodoxin